MQNAPIPANEMERLISLADFDLDYSNLEGNFQDLTKLAAKVAGTHISLVNLVDSFTQWSVAKHGIDIDQMPREDSVCQYTIMTNSHFEVEDLRADERFKDKSYVTDDPKLRYYYGVPLKTNDGHNLGALCVLDRELKFLTPEKSEMLKIIADEIVNRLKAFKVIDGLKHKLAEANETKKKVAHDIRGPLGGIIGLAQVISEQGESNQLDEVLEFINLIHNSGRSLLELADEILMADRTQVLQTDQFNLLMFKDKLEKLYSPQAKNKNIDFKIDISAEASTKPFPKNKLLQITGNLISNAMKFTPQNGKITVDLQLKTDSPRKMLIIKVTDSGVGLDEAGIAKILSGNASSTNGTGGEQGYGFGLALVKHLVDTLRGTMNITSTQGYGATFEINLPQA